MGKIAKRIIIVAGALCVVFFAGSLLLDRHLLEQTYQRVQPATPRVLPNEDFAAAYRSTPVEFQLDGSTLRGFVYEAPSPKGFVVFRHGIFSQHTDYLALICAMVDRGWTVFAYDAIGCGISDGDNVKGMAQSAIDVPAALSFVRERGLAGDLPIALWGHSWGGYGVAAAMDTDPNVAACVTMSGYNDPVDIMVGSAVSNMGPAAATQAPTLWLLNKVTFGADSSHTGVSGINKTSAPVLIIHGTEDAVVSYDGTSIIAQRGKITNPNVQYVTESEAGRNGHNSYFYSVASNDYLAQKRAELERLSSEHPNGIPDDAVAEFFADFDVKRANEANPELIDAIDAFLTEAVSGR